MRRPPCLTQIGPLEPHLQPKVANLEPIKGLTVRRLSKPYGSKAVQQGDVVVPVVITGQIGAIRLTGV